MSVAAIASDSDSLLNVHSVKSLGDGAAFSVAGLVSELGKVQ